MANFLGELLVRITGDSTQLDSSIDQSGQRLQQFGAGAQRVGGSLSKNLTTPILAVGGAMVAATVSAGNYADSILDLEQVTGLSSDTLQEFENVATVAGVSFEGLTGTISRFTSRLPTIESGTSETAVAFDSLGVNLRDAQGEIRSTEELFPELISALQDIENTTERNAVAQQVFGRSLGDIAPVLGLTADQIRNAREEAHELGLVQEREVLVSLNDTRISLDTLKERFNNTTVELANSFIPALESILPVVERVLTVIADLAQQFGELDEDTQNTILTLLAVAAAAGPVVSAIGGISTAIGVLLPLVAGPAGIAAGIALLVAGFVAAVQAGAEFSDTMGDVAESVGLANTELSRSQITLVVAELERMTAAGALTEQRLRTYAAQLGVAAELVQNIALESGVLTERLFETRGSFEEAATAARLAREEISETEEAISDTGESTSDMSIDVQELSDQLRDLQKEFIFTRETVGFTNEEMNVLGAQIRSSAIPALEEIATVNRLFGEESQTAAEQMTYLRGQIERAIELGFEPHGLTVRHLISLYEELEEQSQETGEIVQENAITTADVVVTSNNAIADSYRDGYQLLNDLSDQALIRAQEDADARVDITRLSQDEINGIFTNGRISEEEAKKQQKRIIDRQKAIAITEAIIQGSLGVARTLASVPFPFNLGLAASQGILAAAQVAEIRSRPIPALADGGLFSGPALIGEAGPELAVPLSGPQGTSAIQGFTDAMARSQSNVSNDNSSKNITINNLMNLSDKQGLANAAQRLWEPLVNESRRRGSNVFAGS
jgi:hypothetical protein